MAEEKLNKTGLQVSKRGRCQVRDADLQIHGPFKEAQFFQESVRSRPNDLFALKRLSAWANKLNRSG
jgi:hypothetical protein